MNRAVHMIAQFALITITTSVYAQCEPTWDVGESPRGVDRAINASTGWDPDGAGPQTELLIVGGDFREAGGIYAGGIAAWDGVRWQPLGYGVIGTVYALAVFNGELIAGGNFTIADDPDTRFVARWDGKTWHVLGKGLNAGVTAFTVLQGALIVAGGFTEAGGLPCRQVAAWNGLEWKPLGADFRGCPGSSCVPLPYALTVHQGQLYVGGTFTSVNGIPANCVARWDGNSWWALDSGITGTTSYAYSPTVRSMASYRDKLVVTGGFSRASNLSVNNIAAWNGVAWETLGSGIYGCTPYGNCYAAGQTFFVWDEKLIVGGLFEGTQAGIDYCLAAWNGTAWSNLGRGFLPPIAGAGVRTLCSFGGTLAAGGNFNYANETPCRSIAIYDGVNWNPEGLGVNASVYAWARYGDEWVAGGSFTQIGGIRASRIAKWDGVEWSPLGTGMMGPGLYPFVRALRQYQGRLMVGGGFTSAGGITANYVAQWDGLTWSELNTNGALLNGYVEALEEYDGKLVVGGFFTSAGGTPLNGIAKWSGSGWESLGNGVSGCTQCIVGVREAKGFEGRLIVAGTFDYAGLSAANNIAAWDGVGWVPMGAGLNGTVHALAEHNGELYAGGDFSGSGTIGLRFVAKWNRVSWEPVGNSLNHVVFVLASYRGALFAGGNFGIFNGTWPRFLAQWDGIQWSQVAGGPDHLILSFGVFKSSLFMGGLFSFAGSRPSAFYASLSPKAPIIDDHPHSTNSVFGSVSDFWVGASATSDTTYQWRKHGIALADNNRISGSQSSALRISRTMNSDEGSYDVVVMNPCGTTTSKAASLKVVGSPGILSDDD